MHIPGINFKSESFFWTYKIKDTRKKELKTTCKEKRSKTIQTY